MKCRKCGAELPENEIICPACGASQEDLSHADIHRTENTSVRSQTIPQRPKTAYPDRHTDRRHVNSRRRRPGRVRTLVLILVVAALLCAAAFVGYRILQNGQEEPNLGEPDPVNSGEQTPDVEASLEGQDEEGEDEPAVPATYDLTGVWVWDADMALMKETVWQFAEDGTLTIYYFGLGNVENPFDTWPETYAYDKDSATLTLAGEEIKLTWKNETSFTMNAETLGICDAKKTDEAHIPTGAVDIREVEPTTPEIDGTDSDENMASSSVYIFEDSDSRYLTSAECEAKTAEELRIARNEIYARHGRLFDSEDLQAYFSSQDWYDGTIAPEDFDYTVLNDYEIYNVNLMKSIEDSKNT